MFYTAWKNFIIFGKGRYELPLFYRDQPNLSQKRNHADPLIQTYFFIHQFDILI
jgi:hypothetical protein